MQNSPHIDTGYAIGHPWYYLLGGDILFPKQILADVKDSGFQGYMTEDIDKIDRRSEPKRSADLRALKQRIEAGLFSSLSRYRELAGYVRNYRLRYGIDPNFAKCRDMHTNIGLKYNHICHDFAHLVYLDKLDTGQMELFDF